MQRDPGKASSTTHLQAHSEESRERGDRKLHTRSSNVQMRARRNGCYFSRDSTITSQADPFLRLGLNLGYDLKQWFYCLLPGELLCKLVRTSRNPIKEVIVS